MRRQLLRCATALTVLLACGDDAAVTTSDTDTGTGSTTTTTSTGTATTTTTTTTTTSSSSETSTTSTTTTTDTETVGNTDTESAGPVCGNGVIEGIEACDDGNQDDTDECLSTCVAATCGDGFVWAGMEACDEGPSNADDGACTTLCVAATCGDGLIQAGVEACDDGNQDDTDACLSTCVDAACGDGVVWTDVEACDDGNDVDDDACTNQCGLPGCGDGILQMGEECDDGNDVDTDACPSTCLNASCGDMLVWEGNEECDDGNDVDTDECLPTCDAASCGDGKVWEGVEECDDGNMIDDDACSNMCTFPVASADCSIVSDMPMWSYTGRGVDLRAWTGSTLHWIGCLSSNGCAMNAWYCTYNENTQTLEFGSTQAIVRSAVDPGNVRGDDMPGPGDFTGCCSAPLGLCNGPDSANNGVGINNAKALCNALGYQDGSYLAESQGNVCPEPHATNANGLEWTSDFVNSDGGGRIWQCTTFK